MNFPVHFELGSSFVNCVVPGHTVGSKVRPLPVVDVAGSGAMTRPSELVLQDHGFDTGNLSLL